MVIKMARSRIAIIADNKKMGVQHRSLGTDYQSVASPDDQRTQ